MSSRAAIVGIHEYPHRVDRASSAMQIKARSAAAALEDAGLTLSDVDALYDAGEASRLGLLHTAEYLGVTPHVVGSTDLGGASFEGFVTDAAEAIGAGRCEVALITYGSTLRSTRTPPGGGQVAPPTPASNMERPWGLTVPGSYALAASRYLHQSGVTPEEMAGIAVTTRTHAMRNPLAVAGLEELGIRDIRELTVDDVVSSRLVADPLRVLDCCLVTDGGGAVVVASEEVARSCAGPPAWVLGGAASAGFVAPSSDLTTTAASVTGPDALRMAGVTIEEVDVAMLYDSFTITVLLLLEDLGFCGRGEAGVLASSGNLRWDVAGAPALNTDGGGLSSTHSGMRGIYLLIESVRQLRGDSTSQVEHAEIALAHGNGGQLAGRHAGATVVLGANA